MVRTLGLDFQPNLKQFPVDLSGINLPLDWDETKWKHTVTIQSDGGEPQAITIDELVHQYTMGIGSVVNIQSVNDTNGRQLFFGLNPESRPGNKFTGWIYRERGGGGATIVPYSLLPDGTVVVGLLTQDRPLLYQGGSPVLQVMGGYPIATKGTADQIHAATLRSELDELGGFNVVPGRVIEIGARYSTNKAMVLTGEGQGISVQILEIPHKLLVANEDGQTWSINRDLVRLEGDRTLEGIVKETFYVLDDELVRRVSTPDNGAPSCIHTETAIRRAKEVLDQMDFN